MAKRNGIYVHPKDRKISQFIHGVHRTQYARGTENTYGIIGLSKAWKLVS